MTSVLNVMEDYLIFRKWNYCRIDGSTHIDERQRQMDAFNAEKTGFWISILWSRISSFSWQQMTRLVWWRRLRRPELRFLRIMLPADGWVGVGVSQDGAFV